jgi:hypothetical protein
MNPYSKQLQPVNLRTKGQGYCLPKKPKDRKSRDTVPLKIISIFHQLITKVANLHLFKHCHLLQPKFRSVKKLQKLLVIMLLMNSSFNSYPKIFLKIFGYKFESALPVGMRQSAG